IAGCSKESSSTSVSAPAKPKQLYTCGMHPQVIQDHPGNCPICGMKLTPILNTSGTETNSRDLSAITINPAMMQNMTIKTTPVRRGPLRKTVRATAIIEHSEAAAAQVTTKFKGWIEKLYVATTGQHVQEGDPLFEIYSPELYSAQNEYLLALRSPGDNG